MAKTVAIIGAGPSGLVAAKTLVHDAPKDAFHVTVFEKSHRMGGLWPIGKVDDDGLVNPDMCTNQSRHTVSFSDLAWGEDSGSFPRAWEVGGYLERYGEVYGGYEVKLKTGVERVERVGGRWGVTVKEEGKEEERKMFDYLIVATGFFGKPKLPSMLENARLPVWHSSKIRDVKDLLTDGGKRDLKSVKGRNIVVVGGQMSGVETAAAVAFQLSSLVNSPGDGEKEWGEYRVVNVVQKPVWVMPLFFPKDPEGEIVGDDGVAVKKINASPEFLPLDLVNYNLGWRPPGPIQNTSGEISVEGAKMVHGFMSTYIGTDQSELGVEVLGMKGDRVRSEPPMLACSDYYTEFVRSGMIKVVQGRMSGVGAESLEVVDSSGKIEKISDIAAIISATGFDASPSLSFLPSELLQQLQFDPNDDSFPLALNVHTIVNRSIPSLGFVGFYRSPYWGVMEMQARYLAALWSEDKKAHKALEEDTTMESMMKLRKNLRRAQFPMGDYAYLMESLAEILDIKRTEPENSSGRSGIVLPPRYLPSSASSTSLQEAKTSLSIIDRIFQDSQKGKFIARATFRALQGTWSLSRSIKSQLATFPSGTLTGTASFLPRSSTDENVDMEYLYFEEGDFRPSWGGTMTARRSYVYHYTEKGDSMDVWFAKGDGKTSDYFFHKLEFLVEGRRKSLDEPWRAKSSHLCIEDLYNVEYEFFFKGTTIEKWTSKYNVKGPKKDYTIENLYTRPLIGA